VKKKRKASELDEDLKSDESVIGSSVGTGGLDASPCEVTAPKRRQLLPGERPSKRNVLLAQLLSKTCEVESDVGSSVAKIATITPLSQMLQHGAISIGSVHDIPNCIDGDESSAAQKEGETRARSGSDGRLVRLGKMGSRKSRVDSMFSSEDVAASKCLPQLEKLDFNHSNFNLGLVEFPETNGDTVLAEILRNPENIMNNVRLSDAGHGGADSSLFGNVDRLQDEAMASEISLDEVTLLAEIEQAIEVGTIYMRSILH